MGGDGRKTRLRRRGGGGTNCDVGEKFIMKRRKRKKRDLIVDGCGGDAFGRRRKLITMHIKLKRFEVKGGDGTG